MINPIKIEGIWDDGYALDKYMAKSEYVGDDVFGNPQFNNTYTVIGKLLHAMKYNGHYNTSEEIVTLCEPFVRAWLEPKNVDIILPVPPSSSRVEQPVFLIAELLGDRLGIQYSDGVLLKTAKEPVKNIPKAERNLAGVIRQLKPAKRKCSILLVDDFYSTGQTASECVSVLKSDPLIDKVYYLAIAKTK